MPEFLLADVLRPSPVLKPLSALPVLAVVVPHSAAIECAPEAAVRNGDLYNEWKVAFAAADCHLLLSE
jgi:hypothetical protein